MNEARYREAERRLWESVGAKPIERHLHLPRTGGSVRVQEVGEGPAVVFMHGVSNAGSSWAPLVAGLAGFRCILLDRPGCGLSEPLTNGFENMEKLDAFADTLIVDVLDALLLARAHVASTSYGGYFALRAAAAHPERIDRIVEFGWMFGAPSARWPFIMRLGAVPVVGRLVARIPPNERAVRMIFKQIGLGQALKAGRISQEATDWFLSLLRDTETMRNEIKAAPRVVFLRAMNDRLLLPASLLAGIHTSVRFLWGEEDPFGTPDIARQFVEQLPQAELEFMPGAGHAVWMDDPAYAAATTIRFFKQ